VEAQLGATPEFAWELAETDAELVQALEGEYAGVRMGDEWEAARLVRRLGDRVPGQGWRVFYALIAVAVLVLPAVVVSAVVDLDAGVTVLGVTIGLVVSAAVVVGTAGTPYGGDY
jgi:hypothetical protein